MRWQMFQVLLVLKDCIENQEKREREIKDFYIVVVQ